MLTLLLLLDFIVPCHLQESMPNLNENERIVLHEYANVAIITTLDLS